MFQTVWKRSPSCIIAGNFTAEAAIVDFWQIFTTCVLENLFERYIYSSMFSKINFSKIFSDRKTFISHGEVKTFLYFRQKLPLHSVNFGKHFTYAMLQYL